MTDTSPGHARAIGEKLRTVRQERQMSLRELANKADVSASMLSQIETGKVFPSVRSLYGIANALGVSVDYFFPEQNHGQVTAEASATSILGAMTASELRDARVNGSAATNQEFASEIQ